jgi:hypothetical protein
LINGASNVTVTSNYVNIAISSSNVTSFSNTGLAVLTSTNTLSPTSGALIVTGGVGIGGNAYIGGNLTVSGTLTTNGNLNGTAFAVVGSGAVGNVALGFFPPAGTPAEMAIRDYSAANSSMYFDSTIGSANVGGQFQFRGTSSFTQWAKIDRYGINLPTRPAFRVNGTGIIPQTSTANVNLKGAAITTIFNQGSYFDATTGKFTAPVAGIYNVTLVARVGTNNGLNQIAVLKNGLNSSGNVVCFWETDTNAGTASHFGTCGTIILAVGDYLSANILAGNISFDGNDNWTVTYIG